MEAHQESEGVDFVGKLTDYIDVLRHDGLKKNTRVLIVTTSQVRAQSIKDLLAELAPDLAKRFYINVLDYFANPWRMPPILADVLEPWERADGVMVDITKAAP